jgi:hypothetical protein
MRRLRSLPSPVQCVLALALLIAVSGGSAIAAIRITGRDVVDHSLTGRDIAVSSLTGAHIRDRSLTPRDFRGSVRGPQGPQGPNGQTALVRHVADPVALAPNGGFNFSTAYCAPGEVIVSGGVLPGDSTSVYFSPFFSAPDLSDASKQGWAIGAWNAGSAPATFRAVATCAVKNASQAKRRSRSTSRPQTPSALRHPASTSRDLRPGALTLPGR